MVSWLIATFRPLTWAGETSAMYIGLNIEAMPTPMPAAKRMVIKKLNPFEKAIPADDTAKMKAASNKPGLRPYLSVKPPANKQPAIQPNPSEPVKKPSFHTSSTNSVLKKGNAPEITAKSKPNR